MVGFRAAAGIVGGTALVAGGGLEVNHLLHRGKSVDHVTDALTKGELGILDYRSDPSIPKAIYGYDENLGSTYGFDRTPVFVRADPDGDGRVSRGDLRAAVVAADRNGDGHLNRSELRDGQIVGTPVAMSAASGGLPDF
ncbi:MAG: hypothetical protein JWM98_3063 [Thermoleophilia bacterium]|nr:hypothetical protein [Thermoleophilia bacterium]